MRSLRCSLLMALALVLIAAGAQAQSHDGHGSGNAQHEGKAKKGSSEKGWKEERHWAADGCDRHMGGVMEKHIEGCHVSRGVHVLRAVCLLLKLLPYSPRTSTIHSRPTSRHASA
jgi:hypothetical protein